VAAGELPILIVGDVHGDVERLFAALEPYPADRWYTIFLGDLVDYGIFGVGAMRYARDRANSEVLLGNHEVAMLWALRDPTRVGFWMSIGGQEHDLAELRKDQDLQGWMRERPALLPLHDRTLVQHYGNDAYLDLISIVEADPVGHPERSQRFRNAARTRRSLARAHPQPAGRVRPQAAPQFQAGAISRRQGDQL